METKEVKTTTIYQGQDSNGNPAALVTPEAAVFDENGISLKDKLASIDPEALKSLYESQLTGIESAGNVELEKLKTSQTVLEVPFNTDRFITRNSIAEEKRHKGMIISYIENSMPILECYTGTSLSSDFDKDTNWQLLNTGPIIIDNNGASSSGIDINILPAYHTLILIGNTGNTSFIISSSDPTHEDKLRNGVIIEIFSTPQDSEYTLRVGFKTDIHSVLVSPGKVGHIKLMWIKSYKKFLQINE